MADKISYFSRFTAKFVEIIAAGVATAVSGYLVAHLGGYLSTPAPTAASTAIDVAPHAGGVPENSPAHAVQLPSAKINARSLASVQRGNPPAAQSVTTPLGGTGAAPAAKTAKHAAIGAGSTAAEPRTPARIKRREAAEAKPRGIVDAKRREAAEAKPRGVVDAKRREAAEAKRREAAASRRSAKSVAAEARAALAKVDATRRPQPNAPSLQTEVSPPPPRIETPSRSVKAPSVAGIIPATAHAADDGATPHTANAAPQSAPTPLQSAPLATVEIKSLPIAAVGTSPAAQDNVSQANAPQASAVKQKTQSTGLFSAIEKIPDLLRSDSAVPADKAPRPPLPVGQ